jgi:hypothetical protein
MKVGHYPWQQKYLKHMAFTKLCCCCYRTKVSRRNYGWKGMGSRVEKREVTYIKGEGIPTEKYKLEITQTYNSCKYSMKNSPHNLAKADKHKTMEYEIYQEIIFCIFTIY